MMSTFQYRIVKKAVVTVLHCPELRQYLCDPPFNPPNPVYSMTESLIREMESEFREAIKPGDHVVIKPNLVKHTYGFDYSQKLSKTTHGGVIRPVLDKVIQLLNGKGRITICDTPIETSDFDQIMKNTGIAEMVETLRKIHSVPIELLDLRKYRSVRRPGNRWKTISLPGDPLGYTEIDLGGISEFTPLDCEPQNYHTLSDHTVNHFDPRTSEPGETNKFHYPGHHRYLVSNTILNADVIISMPKLKTHRKAGLTCVLKNTIGIVADKVYMPHHRPGIPPNGDALPLMPSSEKIRRRLRRKGLARVIGRFLGEKTGRLIMRSRLGRIVNTLLPKEKSFIEWGDWYGNDTLWRTILDLNKILLYADKEGVMQESLQRAFIAVVDGIIALEGEGPVGGEAKECGILVGGKDPLNVDWTCAWIMGFDPIRIPTLNQADSLQAFSLGTRIGDLSDGRRGLPKLDFSPPRGWKNSVELKTQI